MFQWITAWVSPARSARNSVGIRLNTSSRIVVRSGPAMTSAIVASGVDLTSRANSFGSTAARASALKSVIGEPLGCAPHVLAGNPSSSHYQTSVGRSTLPNMSLGETAALRATAHPIRLRIMSLLTGAPLTAAEVARELGLTHANASYHLRTLLAAGMIVPAGEERIRGGVAKRYRYDAAADIAAERARGHQGADHYRGMFAAVAAELIRRSRANTFSDAANVL